MGRFGALLYGIAFFITCLLAQESPCPTIFSYRVDQSGKTYGHISVISSDPNSVRVILEMVVAEVEKSGDESQSVVLDMTSDDAINSLKNRRPVHFRVNFPSWITTIPYISKIMINDKQICTSRILLATSYTTYTLSRNITVITRPYSNCTTTEVNVAPTLPTRLPPSRITTTIPKTQMPEISNSHKEIEECGISSQPPITQLIFNGKETTILEYPWLVAILQGRPRPSFKCGGTLISNMHVLTAAHCTVTYRKTDLRIVLGRTDITDPYSAGLTVSVRNIFNHEDYDGGQADADVSIILLSQTVAFSDTVRPACIWPSETSLDSIVSRQGCVAGWGSTARDVHSNIPNEVFMPVVSNQDCLDSNVNFKEVVTDRTFCAGLRDGSGPCHGDSGSGFYLFRNGRAYIRGIVSSALSGVNDTCDLSNYIIFVDVAKLYTWIIDTIN